MHLGQSWGDFVSFISWSPCKLLFDKSILPLEASIFNLLDYKIYMVPSCPFILSFAFHWTFANAYIAQWRQGNGLCEVDYDVSARPSSQGRGKKVEDHRSSARRLTFSGRAQHVHRGGKSKCRPAETHTGGKHNFLRRLLLSSPQLECSLGKRLLSTYCVFATVPHIFCDLLQRNWSTNLIRIKLRKHLSLSFFSASADPKDISQISLILSLVPWESCTIDLHTEGRREQGRRSKLKRRHKLVKSEFQSRLKYCQRFAHAF